MNTADRLNTLPPYLFADLEAKATEMRKRGINLIDLGIADPDMKPPIFLKQAIIDHLEDEDAHRYPTSRGDIRVRERIAEWFYNRFGVGINPETEIAVTLGAKEGLTDLARAFVNPGDKVGVPDPGYPVYEGACSLLNDAEPVKFSLPSENGFLPDLSRVPDLKALFLNYPNNPTGMIAPESFYRAAADYIETHPETLVAWDAAYSEVTFSGYKAPSILQYHRRCVELHSLSKTMNCTGYRVGFCVGDSEMLDALVRIKSQIDSGTPVFIQRAMADALDHYEGEHPPEEMIRSHEEYGKRKNLLEKGLAQVEGVLEVFPSPATFFTWFRVEDDVTFVDRALEKGVILTPGSGFGESGKGFVRASVTTPGDTIKLALERLHTL